MKPVRRSISMVVVMALMLSTGVFVGRASAAQPHMTAALDALRLAKSELAAAEADKGGHRTRALELVQSAIGQVEAGMRFDRRH